MIGPIISVLPFDHFCSQTTPPPPVMTAQASTVMQEKEEQDTNNLTWSAWVDMGRADMWGTETPSSEATITVKLANFLGECTVSRVKLMEKSGFFRGMLSRECQVSLLIDSLFDKRISTDFYFRKRPPSQ